MDTEQKLRKPYGRYKFTLPFYPSVGDATDDLDGDELLAFFNAYRAVARGEEPDLESMPKAARVAFKAQRANLDKSIERQKRGAKRKHSKGTATAQQEHSKGTATAQQEQRDKIRVDKIRDTHTSVCATNAHTRAGVFAIGKDPAKFNPPIPDGWLDYFSERMTQSGWADKDGKPIRNLAATISAWWARDKATWVEPKKPQPPKPTAPADWTLCLERCANCEGNECTRGIKVPPDKNPMRPMQPEECPLFTAIAKEGAA